MNISMYQASVPTMIRALNNLAAVLEKGAAHCEAKKIDPSVMVTARLFPDMLPLSKQVQIASDTAKGAGARLAQMEPPAYEDNETTFPQLIERARKTVKYLESLDAAKKSGIPVIAYGQFINDVISFLIIAAAVFVMVKQVNRIKSGIDRPSPTAAPTTKDCPFCMSTISIKASRCPNCTSQL